ncbi:hypothetical protein CNY89_02835 [Amaricoccus sp. HAR-UPW-R2A-40]|nr:hypothetical protein CNY89_02835 [Amaricoccus sp. HAR-UPW-R2A-40]
MIFDHCDFSPISGRFTFPDVSSVVGWTVDPRCASDARRSDGWQREQNSTILDLSGTARTITAAVKATRHCDAIQSVRTLVDVQILDSRFTFPDQYCHMSILQTNASHFSAVPYSTGFEMRRCSILGAHSMMPGLIDFIDPIVHTCLYRRVSPLNWSSGNTTYPAPFTRQLDRSGLNPSSRVLMTNCVLPAGTSTTNDFLATKVTQTDVVFSNSAVPDGWAATDVALGKVGAYGYEN